MFSGSASGFSVRWIHEDCVEDCTVDSEGRGRICPMFNLLYDFITALLSTSIRLGFFTLVFDFSLSLFRPRLFTINLSLLYSGPCTTFPLCITSLLFITLYCLFFSFSGPSAFFSASFCFYFASHSFLHSFLGLLFLQLSPPT